LLHQLQVKSRFRNLDGGGKIILQGNLDYCNNLVPGIIRRKMTDLKENFGL
jgi:hypothetical protein